MTASSHKTADKCAKEPASSLEHIIASIPPAGGFDELRPVLAALSRETERILGTRPLTLEEANRMADLLSLIRVLLKQAACGKCLPGDEDLVARYREIEGAAKEIRNDQARAARHLRA